MFIQDMEMSNVDTNKMVNGDRLLFVACRKRIWRRPLHAVASAFGSSVRVEYCLNWPTVIWVPLLHTPK